MTTTQEFKKGTTYELNEDWQAYYDLHFDGQGYHYVKPASYTGNGCQVADCWLINSKGQKHPSFKEHPIAVNIASVTSVTP